MGKLIKEASFYIPRNPNVTSVHRDEVLKSGVQFIPAFGNSPKQIFAYRMKMGTIAAPAFSNLMPVIDGYLNCYNDGLVFFPDVDPGLGVEIAHAIAHAALGPVGEGIFSTLGPLLSKVTGEVTTGKLTEQVLMKLGNKRKMMEKALASEGFFCIPYAELTRFIKKTEQVYAGERYTYILTHETTDGKNYHYLLSEKAGGFLDFLLRFELVGGKFPTYHGGWLDEMVLSKERLDKEIENLAFNILKEKIAPFAESFLQQYADAAGTTDTGRQKEIEAEYEKQLNEKIISLGYTSCILDGKNFNYIGDRILATEILEKLSPTIQAFKDANVWSTLIKQIEASSEGKARDYYL